MSLSATLSNALSGLSAAQRALSVTANNVANANTEGYSRKEVNQSTRVVDGQSLGVQSGVPTRVVDQFLTTELRRQESGLGRSTVLAEAYQRIESGILGSPGEQDRGLAAQLSRLSAELEQLANEPESRPLRTAVLGSITDMLGQISSDTATVQQLRGDADRRIGQTVQSINAGLVELHALNNEIARSGGSADLEDRRDLVLNQLARQIDISTFRHDDGRVAVYTSGGNALLEQSPSVLRYTPAATVSASSPFAPIEIYTANEIDPDSGAPLPGAVAETLVTGGYRAVITPELQAQGLTDAIVSPLTGGSLQGLIEVRDRILPALADQLTEVGQLLQHALNRAHNGAMPYPLPTGAVGSRQDFTGFPAAPADLGGAASLVVLASDGSVAADITVTVAGAASPAAIAGQIDTALGALGTAQLDPTTGALTITLGNDPAGEPYRMAWEEGDSRITVTDDAGHSWDYGFAHYFGLNDLVVPATGGRAEFAVRSDIAADSRLLSNVVMTRDAGAPVVGGIGDKRGLQALAGALASELGSVARGGLPASSTTVGRYVSDITAQIAAESGQARNREAAGRAIVEDLAFRQGAVSGVNLDEELAKLVLYQQAYNVSARLIAITNDLFAELVNITR